MISPLHHPFLAKKKGKHPWGAPLALFICVSLVNVLLMPADWLPADPAGWFHEARTLVRTGQLAVDPTGFIPGLFLPHPVTGKAYSKYGLASSLAVVPPMALANVVNAGAGGELMLVSIWQAGVSGALAVLLFSVAGRYSCSVRVRLVYALSVLYATFCWFYLRAQGTELYQCIYFTIWWIGIVGFAWPTTEQQRSSFHLPAAWFAVVCLMHTRPTFALMVPVTVALIAWRVWRGGEPYRRQVSRILLHAVLPACLAAASLMLVNYIKFGAWYYTGYHIPGNGGASVSLGNIPDALGFIFDPQYSVFLTFPVLLFSLPCFPSAWTRDRGPCALVLSITVAQAIIVASFGFWSGEWSEGPRYLLFALPVLSLPFVIFLDRLRFHLKEAKGTAIATAVAITLSCSGFCWYQVIARPMFAWYRIVFVAGPHLDVHAARFASLQPRGLSLLSLYRRRDRLDEHPYMRVIAMTVDGESYAEYRRRVAALVQPSNFFWKQYWLTKAMQRDPLPSSNPRG